MSLLTDQIKRIFILSRQKLLSREIYEIVSFALSIRSKTKINKKKKIRIHFESSRNELILISKRTRIRISTKKVKR